MSNPFLSEIRIMSFNYPPKSWAQCNGQLLPINQNQPLFALLGTAYGGNGQTNFALPDLRGRVAVHTGGSLAGTPGTKFGQEFHTVIISELPAHNHFINATTAAGDQPTLGGNAPALPTGNIYGNVANLTTLAPEAVTNIGGSQPHENRQPYLVVNFCIALQGIFPSQT